VPAGRARFPSALRAEASDESGNGRDPRTPGAWRGEQGGSVVCCGMCEGIADDYVKLWEFRNARRVPVGVRDAVHDLWEEWMSSDGNDVRVWVPSAGAFVTFQPSLELWIVGRSEAPREWLDDVDE